MRHATDAPIRLLVVTNMYPSASRPAYGNFVRQQVDSLPPAGVAPTVMFIDGRTSPTEYLRAIPRVRNAARGEFDLIHAHYGLSGFVALQQSRLPVVTTFHGDDLLGTPDARGRITPKSRVALALSRWAAVRARSAIVVSPMLLESLPEAARPRARILPMGVDLAAFSPMPRDEACRALGLDPGRRRVLFAADPAVPVKRFPLAEAAVARLRGEEPSVELRVACNLPPERMPLEMNACDALVMTSFHEGSPMVVKEALACNLPIVSVDVGDVGERIRGVSACRLVAPDAGAIASALREVVRAGVRADGRRAVEALSTRRIAEELVKIYRGVRPS